MTNQEIEDAWNAFIEIPTLNKCTVVSFMHWPAGVSAAEVCDWLCKAAIENKSLVGV